MLQYGNKECFLYSGKLCACIYIHMCMYTHTPTPTCTSFCFFQIQRLKNVKKYLKFIFELFKWFNIAVTVITLRLPMKTY